MRSRDFTLNYFFDEALGVVRDNPKLKVTFAHFFFMSDNLQRLGDIFDRYPNVNVDITPGVEMYEDFSSHPEKTRIR